MFDSTNDHTSPEQWCLVVPKPSTEKSGDMLDYMAQRNKIVDSINSGNLYCDYKDTCASAEV